MTPFLTPWGLQEEKCVYWKVSVGLKCVQMSRIPCLWNLLSQYWLGIETSFVFFRPPDVVNFRLNSLLETTFAQSKQICSFDDYRDTHTCSIDLVGVESAHSTIEGKDSQMKSETPKCQSHHSPFLARNANGKPIKRDKLTSPNFVARGKTRLAPLAKRLTCSKSNIAPSSKGR